MGYTVLDYGRCEDCGGRTVQVALGADVNGEDDYAGVGWFHIGATELAELCPKAEAAAVGEQHDGGGHIGRDQGVGL